MKNLYKSCCNGIEINHLTEEGMVSYKVAALLKDHFYPEPVPIFGIAYIRIRKKKRARKGKERVSDVYRIEFTKF